MVKKSILAIAILAMLATVTMAQDPTPQLPGQLKIDGGWPKTIVVTWTPIEICCIKVNLKIGYFIEIKDCSSKSINMVQVNCPTGQSFPCYKGCTTISVRANFEAQLGLKLYAVGSIINDNGTPTNPADDKWKAYFLEVGQTSPPSPQMTTYIIPNTGNYTDVQVCVEAWDANIFNSQPGQNPQVGNVCITAIPTATATCP
jgi:hypothetical protein